MDGPSSSDPLLSNGGSVKQKPLILSTVKWILKIGMWVTFLAWFVLIFAYPFHSVNVLVRTWTEYTTDTFLGLTGSVFLLFNTPILLITFLGIAYLIITSREEKLQEKKSTKSAGYRLWTFPVLVDGIFGVVSAAEMIGILVFAFYIIWVSYIFTMQKLTVIFQNESYNTNDKWSWTFRMSARGFGMMGIFCFSFMFIPISRGSVLLRLIDIPFEHAIRYHVWLGHLTMSLITIHGLFYAIGWAMSATFRSEIFSWEPTDGANLAGVINIFFGFAIWVTSIPKVRKEYFELFFYTHHLYIIFIIFLAMHVGNLIFNIAAGGIFLFMLDRFLRFCQSRKTVDIISATSLPCGTTELVLSKPQNLRYNALSFIFLRVRELSLLQWHPFSVSSSPLDGKNHLSILTKAVGDWTAKLRGNILKISEAEQQNEQSFQPHTKLTASVEGPYGHELPYHLTYENLILVAGGIGISPFLAIMRDIFQRLRQGKPCLPRNILLVWAVKRSNELPLISAINMKSIGSSLFDKLNLKILIYITRESEPSLEDGSVQEAVNSSSICPVSNGCGISVLVGTGHNIWSGVYVISSTMGLIMSLVLLNIFYIQPYNITSWWYQGLLLLGCMVASVIIFGGVVVGLWNLWEKRISAQEECEDVQENIGVAWSHEPTTHKDLLQETLASSTNTHYGSRPDFKEIFGPISKGWGHVDVGVIVCGPPTLLSSVAKECRSQNLSRQSNDPIFHFNSHSFNL